MSTKRLNTEIFIERSIKIHGDKYDYSKVIYINNKTKVCIICNKHGEFWQTPKLHMNGRGCSKCGNIVISNKLCGKKRSKSTCLHKNNSKFVPNYEYKKYNINDTNSFIAYSEKLHKHKYDYSKVEYINRIVKICIICPEHGEFWQSPYSHLIGHGCNKCGHKITNGKQTYTFDEFMTIAKSKYKNKYIYDSKEYNGFGTKMKMVCSEHGEFWQIPRYHLNGCGCKECVNEYKRLLCSLGKENFIKKASECFRNYYSYENVIYVNNSMKVSISCPKHGIFLCTPANHLRGRGCPICKSEYYIGETKLFLLLKTIFEEHEIVRQYKSKWLSNNKSLDFFIPKYNIAIEHQGQQHFEAVEYFGGEKKYKRCSELDVEKFTECMRHGVDLFYFSYGEHKIPTNYLGKVYTDENEFIKKLKDIKNEQENNWN